MNLREQFSLHYENIQDVLVVTLFFSLPFLNRFTNACFVMLISLSIIGIINGRRVRGVKIEWFLPTLFVYYALSQLLSGASPSLIEKRLTLLAPILFALNPNFVKPELKKRMYLGFILANLIALIICLARATFRSVTYHDGLWQFDAKVLKDTDYDFLTSSVMGGNYFFGSELSYFLHPTYFGLYIVFAQFLIYYLSKTHRRKLWPLVMYLLLLIGQFLLSSKATIIASLFLTVYIVLTFSIPTAWRITAGVAFAIITTMFVFFNPRFKVFKDTLTFNSVIDSNARYGHALRVLSWDAALDVIRNNWQFGVGEGNKEAQLIETYKKKGYIFPAQERFNTHNQYLDLLVGGGVMAIGLFLYGCGQLLVRSVRESNQPLLFFLLIFLFIALFENLLSRFDGLILFSLFISIHPSENTPDLYNTQDDLKQQ